jgi:polyketide cyclase/dehydrase/lipid transport protein
VTTRRLSAVGAAEPAVTWGRYAVIGAWPTWSPQIVGVETAAERIALGVSGRVHVVGGLRLPFAITAHDEQARTWSWVVRLGPVAMTLNHEVHAEPQGSGTVLVMEGPDPVLLGYAPLAWVALRRLVAR